MSYRELRNFCEQMRGLGYPRIISIENFRRPNFELVADILYWLAQRYDPHIDISDNIEEERHRVEFIKQITQLFVGKARLKINPKKIYQADGYAVQELLKISTFLYKAQNALPPQEDELHEFSLSSKLGNAKQHKVLAQEITELGAKLYDQLGKENEMRIQREKALNFLDNISRNTDARSEQNYIQNCLNAILKQQEQSIGEMKQYVNNLEKDQRTLEEKIRKRTKELEQADKRLKGIKSVKPAYQEEYERYEGELEKIYQIYVEKFRNLYYLEHQLDTQNNKEEERVQEMEKKRKKLKKKIEEEELEILRGDKDIDEALLDAQMNPKQDSRLQSSKLNKREQNGGAAMQMQGAKQQNAMQKQQFQRDEFDDDQEDQNELEAQEGEDQDEEDDNDDGDINDLDEDEDDQGDDDEF